MSWGCQHVRFHCVCVITDWGDETATNITPITTNNCDFMTALELPPCIKMERKTCERSYTTPIKKKSACSLRSAAEFSFVLSGFQGGEKKALLMLALVQEEAFQRTKHKWFSSIQTNRFRVEKIEKIKSLGNCRTLMYFKIQIN